MAPLRKKILGISCYYHDSAAVLTIDGKIVAGAHEERFTRKKHDDNFPTNAIKYVLAEANLKISELDLIVFYDKPFLKFERLLETYHAFAPTGFVSFVRSMPLWIKEKIFMKNLLKKNLSLIDNDSSILPQITFTEHHLSHMASAFYPSPFSKSAILTVDGVGEWATTTVGYGEGNNIKIIKEMHFPHSIGLLYSAFTYYCGFRVNSGEYKLMGLAPYGHKGSDQVEEIKRKILDNIVDIKADGSIFLNMDFFDFATGLKMINENKWQNLFGQKVRNGGEIEQFYMDVALAIQEITEMIMVRLALTAKKLTGAKNLVMAGGVALNCVANEKIIDAQIFDNVWVQPASGDAGGALGASLSGYYIYYDANREVILPDAMSGSYLGPKIDSDDPISINNKYGAPYKTYSDEELYSKVAQYIADGKVVGWVQGRMEWGPRALGNRSILGDPRNPEMQKKLNLKIKYREGFRPFAPSVLEEDLSSYFETNNSSPYMLFTAPVKKEIRKALAPSDWPLYKRLYQERSVLPAITHLDYSARIQSVSKETNSRYWNLINAFKKITGYGVIVNTSFNVRGEPIVCDAFNAFRCFMNTEMDYLVIGNSIFDKNEQVGIKDLVEKNVFGED